MNFNGKFRGVTMIRILPVFGAICCLIIFIGFFSPWLELYSSPYNLEGVRVKDQAAISGWDLSQGRIRVVQMIESQELLRWEYYRTLELRVESKFYPYLCLIGGILLFVGGIITVKMSKNIKIAYLIILSGSLLSFFGEP